MNIKNRENAAVSLERWKNTLYPKSKHTYSR